MDYNKIFLLDVYINNKELALLEAISKEQKELDVFYRLRSYFHDKWNNKKIKTKEEYNKKRTEFALLNYFVNLGLEEAKLNNNSCLANVLDINLYFKINIQEFSSEYTIDGIELKTNTEEIRRFIVMHEYDHLYFFLKNVIEK